MSERFFERSSFLTGSQPTNKVGQTAYLKFYDNTSGLWERMSGSGAPNVIAVGSVGITGSSTSVTNNTLYTFYNVSIGASGSTGSSTGVDVSTYSVKSIYAFIGTTQNASGSLVVSGSFDKTNYFQLKSGSLASGSLSYFTFFDGVQLIKPYLYNSATTAISGSLSVVVY